MICWCSLRRYIHHRCGCARNTLSTHVLVMSLYFSLFMVSFMSVLLLLCIMYALLLTFVLCVSCDIDLGVIARVFVCVVYVDD